MTNGGAASHERPLCRCHDEPMTRRNDRRVGWRCSVAHRRAKSKHYRANAEAELYAQGRRRLRSRIERKRQKVNELEASLAEENTRGDGARTHH